MNDPFAGLQRGHYALTRREERVFCALVLSPLMTREQGLSAMYFDRLGDEPCHKMVDVTVCKLRQKLPREARIQTAWGRGYFLDEATRARFRPLVAGPMLTPRPEHGRVGAT